MPLAEATAQDSYTLASIRFRQTGSFLTSPIVIPEAAVVSAQGASIASLFHNIFCSSVLNWQLKPNCLNFSIVDASLLSPIEGTERRTDGDRGTIFPGATRSDSTAIVAGTTRS